MRALVFSLLASLTVVAQNYQPTWESIDSRPTPAWFRDAKFGIFIHWGVYAVPAYALPGNYSEWYWNRLTAGKSGRSTEANPLATWDFHKRNFGPDFPYFDFAPQFKAEMYDPAHWAGIFRKSGAKYVVLTSKHHDGYALWPSAEASKAWGRPWNSVDTGPKRDLLGELAESTRKEGVRFGFYYSLYEWYNPLWLSDRMRYVREHMHPQFKDVVQRYKPSIIFADGEWDLTSAEWKSPELLAWLFNESPAKDEVVINDRWGKDSRHKHGGYFTTEYTPGLQDVTQPWEESRGMGHSYGYNRAETVKDYRTPRELILMLVDLVSRGGNFLLDIGPSADGRIPEIMEERLLQMGAWLETNGEAIYGTKPWKRTRQWSAGEVPKFENSQYMTRYEVEDYISRPKPGQAVIEAFFTAKGDNVYAIFPGWPGKQVVLKDIALAAGGSARMLGGYGPVTVKTVGNDLELTLPEVPADAARASYAYAVRLTAVR